MEIEKAARWEHLQHSNNQNFPVSSWKPLLSKRHIPADLEDEIIRLGKIEIELFGLSVRYYICKETRQFSSHEQFHPVKHSGSNFLLWNSFFSSRDWGFVRLEEWWTDPRTYRDIFKAKPSQELPQPQIWTKIHRNTQSKQHRSNFECWECPWVSQPEPGHELERISPELPESGTSTEIFHLSAWRGKENSLSGAVVSIASSQLHVPQ